MTPRRAMAGRRGWLTADSFPADICCRASQEGGGQPNHAGSGRPHACLYCAALKGERELFRASKATAPTQAMRIRAMRAAPDSGWRAALQPDATNWKEVAKGASWALYNEASLRKELAALGTRFATAEEATALAVTGKLRDIYVEGSTVVVAEEAQEALPRGQGPLAFRVHMEIDKDVLARWALTHLGAALPPNAKESTLAHFPKA